MDKNEILIPILTAINDLRGEVRENRDEIRKNREAIQKNSEAIQKNSEKIDSNSKSITSLKDKIEKLEIRMEGIEGRMARHEEESRNDRKAILDVLFSYEQVTNKQYEENKKRIEKIEEKVKTISA